MYIVKIGIRFLVIAALLLLCKSSVYAQQRVQFTQYMFNGFAINPAFAGTDEALSLTFLNRSQWKGLEGAPVTQTLSGHTLFKNRHVGLGVAIINDRVGIHKNLSGYGAFSYHIKVASKSYLSMGIQLGVNNQRADYLSIAGNAANDPKIMGADYSRTSIDFGSGVYYRSPKVAIGLSVPRLLPQFLRVSDTLSVAMGTQCYFLFAKYKIRLSDNLDFEPGFLIKYISGLPVSYDLNANIIISKALTLGTSYRAKESIDVLIKAQITKQLQVGYAYDHVISNVRIMSSTSHEVMVNYLFKYSKQKISSPR